MHRFRPIRRLLPRLRPCLLAGALAASAPPVLAQAGRGDGVDLTAMPIEQLLNLEVVTASKIPQKLSDVPASVSVVTADDIRHYGYRTLADILRSMRGMHITFDRTYDYVGTRALGRPGDFNTRVLILIDGRRLNDAAYDLGAVGGEFPIDTELIERVEFVPGPGSAIYGSSAFFGVVNVITRTGASFGGVQVGLAGASHDTSSARLTAGLQPGGAADLLLSASSLYSRGQDLYFPEFNDAAGGGMAHGLDHDRQKRLFAKLRQGPLTLQAYYGRRIKGVATAAYGQQFGRPGSITADEYAVGSAAYQAPLADGLELYAGVSLNRYRYWTNFLYDWSPRVNHDRSRTRTVSGEVRLLATAWRDHRVVAGAEYVRDSRREMRNVDTDPYALYLDFDVPRSRYGIYLQDDIRLGERFSLNLGVRRDHDSEGNDTDNPRIALLYKAAPQLTVKALAGTAFRSANAYERYYETIEYKRNPHLRSERIRTSELSVEYFPTNGFRASAALFQYRVSDLLALASDPADGLLYFSNIDAARSHGLELETEWLGSGGERLKASASLQHARDAAGAWLSNAPRRLAKLNYSMPLWNEALRASAEVQATSRRRTPLGGEVGGFGVVNLTLLTRPFGRNLELSASVYNLLDKRYADGPSEEHYDNSDPPRFLTAIAQPRRNWQLRLTYGFR